VQLYTNNSLSPQAFQFIAIGDNKIKITPKSSIDKRSNAVIEVTGVSPSNYANIALWNYYHDNVINNKLWYMRPANKTLAVTLHKQDTTNTCGPASVRMILTKYGITRTEAQIIDKLKIVCKPATDYKVVDNLTRTLNQILKDEGKSTGDMYKWINISSYTEAQFDLLFLNNIWDDTPIQLLMKISKVTPFQYTSDGHYVVLKGIKYNSTAKKFYGVVNDPHYNYNLTLDVPMSTLLQYSKAHSAAGYLIARNKNY